MLLIKRAAIKIIHPLLSYQKDDISHYYLSPINRDSKHWGKRNLLIFFHLIQTDIIKFLYSTEWVLSVRGVQYVENSFGPWLKG